MKLSIQSHQLIESALREAVSRFTAENEQTVVTDIHLQPKQGSGELTIFDDDDEELAQIIVDEWTDYNQDNFYEDTERLLRSEINKLKDEGIFENLTILKPYSLVLVDEDKESIADLLLVDDDTMLVSEELLKGLDEELDQFLKDLLDD